MSQLVRELSNKINEGNKLPQFASGDTVSVHFKIKEGDKERIQIFQGVVIQRSG